MRYYNTMISQQLIKQVTGEQENDRIYKVDLCNKLITRISGLKPFAKIRCLQLDFNKIGVIENLECLPDLRQLHLQYNELQKLNGLENNKLLTVLRLSSNRIQKIQNIGHLSRLQTLIIDNNRIEKLSGLQTLKDLKYLSMSNNNLTSIDSLPAFSKLEILNADKNKIRKISPTVFGKSNKLTKLDLSFNQLEDITCINGLVALEQLNVSNNKIIDFQPTLLRNLQILNISNNKIEKLPKLAEVFPQLSIFHFRNNQIISEYEIIQAVAQAQMLIQIDYQGNPMEAPQFAQTLYQIYGFDRINQKNYNKPGTRYLSQAQEINKVIKSEGLGEIQNDDDVRKIIMSGFFNDDLETQMTGVKPDRPNSGNRTKIGPALNFEEMEKSYNDIMKNNDKLQHLRQQCLHIFKQNGIKINIPPKQQQTQASDKKQQRKIMITETKNLVQKTSSMNNITLDDLSNRNQEYANKWKQLKNKEKNFNIRGVVRKMSGSQRKSGTGIREDSANKVAPLKQKPELMRTQLNPPRWNNDPALMKTMQARPFSAKKKDV